MADYSGVKAITLAFYTSNGDEQCKVTQMRADATTYTTFGEFDLSLPMGSYTMVVLGYGLNDGEPAITLTSPTSATFGDYPARETFAYTQTVNITNTDAVTFSATLNRIVSKLKIHSTDGCTENAVSVRTTLSAAGKAYRDEEIKVAVDLVKYMKLGNKVFSYLGRDKTMFDNPAGLGKFLWSVRENISNSDTTNLIELLYRIAVLSRDREQQVAATTDTQPEPKSAEDIYRQRLAAKPQKPDLPKFFNEKLTSNPLVVECYYETLHHCGFFIGRTLVEEEKRDPNRRCYAGWKWSHLREAFVWLGFFRADSSKKGFAEHLADVFPYLGATNIQRGFNDRGGFVDDNSVARIISEIEFEFEDVKDLMDKQQ